MIRVICIHLLLITSMRVIQQKLLRSQMNPHFIFNSLASIQNSIINEDPHKASIYLARFSKLVRNILDSSVEEFIPLEQEISTSENYLGLQKIRFPEKFDGVGRQKAQELLRTYDKDHRSLATLITADRIRALNRKMKRKISIEIIDLKDQLDEATGTLVYIKIPYTGR